MNGAGRKMVDVDETISILGRSFLDLVNESDRDRIAGLLSNPVAGIAFEFDFRACNGLLYHSSFVPIFDEMGVVQSLIGQSVEDITAKHQAEEVDRFLTTARASSADAFFPALARFLAQTLRMDFICIDRLDDDGLNVTTLTVWMDGQFRTNFSYELSNIPCGKTIDNKWHHVHRLKVGEKYPPTLQEFTRVDERN